MVDTNADVKNLSMGAMTRAIDSFMTGWSGKKNLSAKWTVYLVYFVIADMEFQRSILFLPLGKIKAIYRQ